MFCVPVKPANHFVKRSSKSIFVLFSFLVEMRVGFFCRFFKLAFILSPFPGVDPKLFLCQKKFIHIFHLWLSVARNDLVFGQILSHHFFLPPFVSIGAHRLRINIELKLSHFILRLFFPCLYKIAHECN